MKPTLTLGQTRTPDGATLTLQEHDGEYFIRVNGRSLMSTTITFQPVSAKFIRITLTTGVENGPAWSMQSVRLYSVT